MAGLITGPAARWLEAHRGELNQRFQSARRRYPGLAPERVLTLLPELLPPLADADPSSAELLSSVYDLILLHAGRNTLSARSGLDVLLREAFPRLRPLLLQRPRATPAALSNAVEHLGTRGAAFARALAALAPELSTSEHLLDAGAVVAWRLGEARLRRAALERARQLPPRALLGALDLGDWPTAAAELALRCLETDAWRHPRAAVADAALESLPRLEPAAMSQLLAKLSSSDTSPGRSWTLLGTVGEFSGFDGEFDTPPLVLDGGTRHRFFARTTSGDFQVDADVFGWTCRPLAPLDFPVRVPRAPSGLARTFHLAPRDHSPQLRPDGTLQVLGRTVHLPALAAASAFTLREDVLVVSHADSHRLRVLALRRERL